MSGFNRRRKWDRFLAEMNPQPEDRILDVGFSDLEYGTTDNFIEKHYPYPDMITALGIEEATHFRERYPSIRAVTYDGGRFPFEDGAFDIAWSNAVLEHVGTEKHRTGAQVQFLREIRRVARRAFVTTPNRWFPAEVHTRTPFLHWLPKPMFDRYLRLRGHDWAAGDYMTLLSEQDLRARLREAGIEDYRLHRNRIGPFVVDFVMLLD
jgi:SAM-dependent methyltransferase